MGCKPERRSSNFCQCTGNNYSSGEAVGCVRRGMDAPEEISCSPVFIWLNQALEGLGISSGQAPPKAATEKFR